MDEAVDQAPHSGDAAAQRQPDLADLLALLFRNWKPLALTTLAGLALGVTLAVISPSQYRSEAVFLIVTDGGSGGLGKLAGNLGGIASLVGVNLGGAGGGNKDEALGLLRSRAFSARFIQQHDLMPKLFPKDWDAAGKKWASSDPDDHPTMAKAVTRFEEKIRDIVEDKRTGIVTLGVLWPDREAAAELANAMIANADAELRTRTIEDARRSIGYLETEIAKTNVAELRETLYRLMEEQLKLVSLSRTRQSFAFRVIDPATPADGDRPEKPRRALLVAVGAVGGFLGGCFLLIALQLIRSARQRT